jgi:DNA-binding MarR family transcriptional regulator
MKILYISFKVSQEQTPFITGSRRGNISEIRSRIVIRLVKELGIPLAEIGRQLGITTSSVSKILSRKGLN